MFHKLHQVVVKEEHNKHAVGDFNQIKDVLRLSSHQQVSKKMKVSRRQLTHVILVQERKLAKSMKTTKCAKWRNLTRPTKNVQKLFRI
jgi:hypothetical protein